MRWHNDDVFVADVGEINHDVIERFAAVPLASLIAHLIAIIERCFITVMAVGNEQPLVFDFGLNFPDQCSIRDAPETTIIAVLMLDLDEGLDSFDLAGELAVDRLPPLRY